MLEDEKYPRISLRSILDEKFLPKYRSLKSSKISKIEAAAKLGYKVAKKNGAVSQFFAASNMFGITISDEKTLMFSSDTEILAKTQNNLEDPKRKKIIFNMFLNPPTYRGLLKHFGLGVSKFQVTEHSKEKGRNHDSASRIAHAFIDSLSYVREHCGDEMVRAWIKENTQQEHTSSKTNTTDYIQRSPFTIKFDPSISRDECFVMHINKIPTRKECADMITFLLSSSRE